MIRLSAMLGRGHLPDERLSELAGSAGRNATSHERVHLDDCAACRSLLGGFSRVDAVLTGPWVDRAVGRSTETRSVATAGGPVRLHRVMPERLGGGRVARRWAAPLGAGALVVGLVATFGLLGLRTGMVPAASGGPSAGGTRSAGPLLTDGTASASPTPAGTRVVARLPLGQFATFSWSPEDELLLVSDEAGSRLYDADGNVVSQFGPIEGWLDSTHLIGGDGFVAPIAAGHVGGPTSNSRVVANGHGSAAIVVAVPACTCDPIIDWYRDGHYVKAQEKASPFGWSPDGKYVLLGHMDAAASDPYQQNGWKGSVDVIDFASGQVRATVPSVRGAMAFNPSATRLAAESDKDLLIFDIATGKIKTVTGARLLGWGDDDHVDVLTTGGSLALVGATASTPDFGGVVTAWSVASSLGPKLVVDESGTATRIAAPDDKTTLLDLSSSGLVVVPNLEGGYQGTALRRSPWSADGRMLALASSDGTSIALISVDPAVPGAVGSALPTPISSPGTIVESDRIALPGPVPQLVSDAKRNALWFLGGATGEAMSIYRYDVATASLSSSTVPGLTRNETRDRLAIAPDGRLWISAGTMVAIYDPDKNPQQSGGFPMADPDIQADPQTGQPNPWIAGIAFDADGNALVARNWVKSLLRLNGSLSELDRIQISDGFPMTGDVVVAGGRVYVGADPQTGLVFGADLAVAGRADKKFAATAMAAVGDRLLMAATPPSWVGPDGTPAAMVGPVLATADLVAGGPGGIAALYSRAAGEIQLRDASGKVSAQAAFPPGKAPEIVSLAFDPAGRLWGVESAPGGYTLARFSPGA